MSEIARSGEEDTRRLIMAITDFLRDQLENRTDFLPEDIDCLEITIQCLEMAYDLDANGFVQVRFARPLLDIFNQVTHPVSVRNKLAADKHKEEGNSYMRQGLFPNAEAEYSDAIELDRWNAIYYCNRSGARIEQRNFFEAISDCRQALLLNPDYDKAHSRMGQAYALMNRPRDAARCFRQALTLEPDCERYVNNLRVAESQIPQPDAAELFDSLLSSFLGGGGTGGVGAMPPSFTIIAEHSSPTRNTSQEGQNIENSDKNNTVTESNPTQVNQNPRSRSTNLLDSLLSSFLGGNDLTGAMPATFAIFTESNTSTRDTSQEGENIVRPETERKTATEGRPVNNSQNIVFPIAYGISIEVVDDESSQQPFVQRDVAQEPENRNGSDASPESNVPPVSQGEETPRRSLNDTGKTFIQPKAVNLNKESHKEDGSQAQSNTTAETEKGDYNVDSSLKDTVETKELPAKDTTQSIDRKTTESNSIDMNDAILNEPTAAKKDAEPTVETPKDKPEHIAHNLGQDQGRSFSSSVLDGTEKLTNTEVEEKNRRKSLDDKKYHNDSQKDENDKNDK